MKRVLFVCMGNICRSPTVEGVARHFLRSEGLHELMEIDSAGTHGYHVGDAPDPRSCAAARRRGFDLSAQRARQVQPQDFERFDLLLAMDHANLAHLQRCGPPQQQHRLRLLTDFQLRHNSPVIPDPYYGNAQGFDHVLDLIEDACDGLLAHVVQQLDTDM